MRPKLRARDSIDNVDYLMRSSTSWGRQGAASVLVGTCTYSVQE